VRIVNWFALRYRRMRGIWVVVTPQGLASVSGKDLIAAASAVEDVYRMVYGADGVKSRLDYDNQLLYCVPWSYSHPNREDCH
jgi:hypothetical protein